MFVAQVTARTAADLVGVNYHTAHLFYHKPRDIITASLELEFPFDGEVEVEESYFGGVRKGTRGRGAVGKVPVFGLLKRGGHSMLPLPKYSPDFNPIRQSFAILKRRRHFSNQLLEQILMEKL